MYIYMYTYTYTYVRVYVRVYTEVLTLHCARCVHVCVHVCMCVNGNAQNVSNVYHLSILISCVSSQDMGWLRLVGSIKL